MMRDPDGTIVFSEDIVIRNFHPKSIAKPFLKSSCAADLVNAGRLISYEFTSSESIESARIPLVSYPFEWCDAQLIAAAHLTLDISCSILLAGYELKDASAWNVIYHGSQPLFCDYLSFQPILVPKWWDCLTLSIWRR